MSVRRFGGNLSYQGTAAEVGAHFSAVGPLVFSHLPTEWDSGRPRGIAFVECHDPAQAEEVIRRVQRFHTQPCHRRPLVVTYARARKPGPAVRGPASREGHRPSSQA